MHSEQRTDQTDTDQRTDEKIDLSEIRDGDGQEYLDRDKLDFDPDDGLYSGTAVDSTSEIPGPHDEQGDEQSVIEQAKRMTEGESDNSMPSDGSPLE
jgi:hypothetical protein